MIDVSPLLPVSLSRYGEAINDALDHFLQNAPKPRNRVGPLEPEHDNSVAAWVRLALAYPTLHKLAQVLARHRDLPGDLRAGLQSLESLFPHTPVAELRGTLRDELGDRLAEIDLADAAMAEGSVAVVVPFTWRRATDDADRHGVLKVPRPGVRTGLDAELAVWSQAARVFTGRCRADGLPVADHGETFDTVAQLLRGEVDFEAEQRNLSVGATAVHGVRGVRVPRLLPFCSRSITAMERIDGVKVTDAAAPMSGSALRVAERLVEALVTRPLWSIDAGATFHADPHAGNLLLTPDGQLVVLDWALTGRLGDRDREHLAQVMLSAALGDAAGLCRALEGLCLEAPADGRALRSAVERALESVWKGRTGPFTCMARLLDQAAMEGGARFSADLLLFRKALLILDGVVADMVGPGGLDRILFAAAFRQLAAEWPGRMFLAPASRRLGSRLSNLDLMGAAMTLPFAAARLLGSPTMEETCRSPA